MLDVRKKHIALHITIFEFVSLFDLSSYSVTISSVSGKKKKLKKKPWYFLDLLPSSLMKLES